MYDCNVDLIYSFLYLEYVGKMIFFIGLFGLEGFVGLFKLNIIFECRRDINFKFNNVIYCFLFVEIKVINVISL